MHTHLHELLINNQCSYYNCSFKGHNPKGTKFIARLWLGYLRKCKFKHSFPDSLKQLCNCGLDIESTAINLFHCIAYFTKSLNLLSIIGNIDNNLLDLCNPVLIKILLFGSNAFDANANTNVLNATIEYVLSTNKFEEEPFQ